MVTIATELHRQHAVWRVVWGTRCGSGHVIIHLPNMMEKFLPNMVKTETVGLATRSLVQVSRWVVSVVSVQTPGFSSGSGQNFGYHRGQANFSACPVWIYTQSSIKNISHYVCGRPTQNQCEYLLFHRWIQVFSRKSESSLQQKISAARVLPELNKLRQNRAKLKLQRTEVPKLSPDLKKVGSWILKNTGLSKDIEEHFQFSTHMLWENLKESFYHIFCSLIWDCELLFNVKILCIVQSNFPLFLRTFEQNLRKTNSGSKEHFNV
jgi:hypothetical protein